MAKKASSNNPLIGDNYFKINPTHILGEEKLSSGRHGEVFIVKGTMEDLAKITAPEVVTKTYDANAGQNLTTETQEAIIEKVMQSESKKALPEKQPVFSSLHNDKIDSFREIVEKYNPEINRKELESFLYTQPELPWQKYIDQFKYTRPELVYHGELCYYKGNLVYRYLYLSGEINKKISTLKSFDKDAIIAQYGEDVYEKQLEMLEKAKPKAATFSATNLSEDQIILLPHAHLAHNFKIKELLSKELPREMSLNDAYRIWLDELPRGEFKKSNSREIISYYLDNKSSNISNKLPKAEREKQERLFVSVKQRTKEEGDKLFTRFVAEALIPEDKLRLEYIWNEKYNGTVLPNLSKIPVGFTFSKLFKAGYPLQLSTTQRDGIAHGIVTKSDTIAFDVGVGKTLTAIAMASMAVENNLCKYPLFAVPNNPYPKWITEIEGYMDEDKKQWMYGALPHYPKVRKLFNLNVQIVEGLKTYTKEERARLDRWSIEIGNAKDLKEIANPDDILQLFNEEKNPESFMVAKQVYSLLKDQYSDESTRIRAARENQKPRNKEGEITLSPEKEKKWDEETAILVKKNEKQLPKKFVSMYTKYLRESYEFDVYELGTIEPAEPGTISLCTFEGLRKLGLKDYEPIVGHMYQILSQGELYQDDKREQAKLYERIKERVVGAQGGPKVYMEELGIDWFCLDEAHRAKKIFTSVKGQPKEDAEGALQHTEREGVSYLKRDKTFYDLNTGQPSAMALISYAIATYVQKNNNNRNVCLLTATPFENSPLEVYSMLSLCNHQYLVDSGLDSLKEFFDTFMKIEYDIKITPTNQVVKDIVLNGFNNLKQMRTLIRYVVLYKTGEEADVERPEKIVFPNQAMGVKTAFRMTPEQQDLMDSIEDYINGDISLGSICEMAVAEEKHEIALAEKEMLASMTPEEKADYLESNGDSGSQISVDYSELNESEKLGVRIMQGLSMMRQIALSPYLFKCKRDANIKPTYDKYITTSPKLMYTMECIKSVKNYHEKKGTKMSGQVIYMNSGVAYFPLIKEYLVKKIGFKDDEVGMVIGGMSSAKKESVKKDFLDGTMKILIGSKAIEVGVDLQDNSSVLYNLYFDWNPTDAKQVEGRIWRQGNRFANVRIVYPMLENSADPILFQYLGEKTDRLKDIWDMEGVKSQLDLKDFDPDKLKYELITDPEKRAQIEIIKEKDKISDEIIYMTNQADEISKIKPVMQAFRETLPGAIDIVKQFVYNDGERLVRLVQEEREKRVNGVKRGTPDEASQIDGINERMDLKENNLKADTKESLDFLEKKPTTPEEKREYDLFVYRKAGQILNWLDNKTNDPELQYFYYNSSMLYGSIMQFRGNYKHYYDIKKKLIDPLGLNEQEAEKAASLYQSKLQALHEQAAEIDDSLPERIQRISKEMAEKKNQSLTALQAAGEFAKYNYLLDDVYKTVDKKVADNKANKEKEKARARARARVRILQLNK